MSGAIPGMGGLIVGGIQGTAPIVKGTRTTSSVASGADQDLDCTLPSGIVVGELILAIVLTDQLNATFTWPAGWTAIPSSGSIPIAAACRVATGSEGSTVRASTSSTVKLMACTYRISNFTGTPEIGTASTGGSPTANPPNLAWSWGVFPTLVIAMMTLNNNSSGSTVAPSGYSGLTTKVQGGDHAAWAERTVTAASEDPGTFTNANANWKANTLAIQGK